jgi:hypothetical protein
MRACLMPLFCTLWMGCGSTPKPDAGPGDGPVSEDTGPIGNDTSDPGDSAVDADGDGYTDDVDCDDDEALVNPGAFERCDGVDNNCDGEIDEGLIRTYFPDLDLDAYGDESAAIEDCERPPEYISRGGDCDDSDPAINPDAVEVCDELDNDCDGEIDGPDPVDPSVFYADEDGDGFGTIDGTIEACSAPDGYTTDTSDCDDSNAYVNPYGIESCDGIDNDCNGSIDEDSAHDGLTWYRDYDGDGFGDPVITVESCAMPGGFVDNDEDCNDHNGSIHPDAEEYCNDIDDDCNGAVDEGFELSTYYLDADGDGYGDMLSTIVSCMALSGYAGVGGDCDDGEYWANPGLAELCDDIDNDCDGVVDEEISFTDFVPDDDGDGYGDASGPIVTACIPPAGHVVDTSDCDDGDSSVNPGEVEACNGVDDNCDGTIDEDMPSYTYYEDGDDDGFGDESSTTTACITPPGYSTLSTDCDDDDDQTYPGAYEFCDGVDDDCNGIIDDDCGYSRNFVLFVTSTFIGSSESTWVDTREDANAYCSTYADDNGIAGSGFQVVYSTPDEDARDYLDYVPGLDQVADRYGTDLGDADIYDGSSPALPDMMSWTIQGSGTDGRFSECSGSYEAGSWPICQYCDKKFTCGSSSDPMFSASACCWTGNRAIICMGETD